MYPSNQTMLTDLYQLTMNAAYFYRGIDEEATFDLFIRSLPPDWGYYLANGIEDAVDFAVSISFTDDDIAYLKTQNFKDDYLAFLREFRFEGDIHAVREGTPIFPAEPLLRVTAKRTQAQILESALLNIINFQTMIATKTSRVVTAAAPAAVVDFGLRRAQGEDAALKGARAAFIAGATATSNVKAGREYGIPIAGTHAHSFVMSFASELEAFRAYAETFPDGPTLLIDTYDTLRGARSAATVAQELAVQGKRLGGVRLDSGDLAQLSKQVRELFDAHRLEHVRIVASNDLNEYRIDDLKACNAPIDIFGVGTELITAKPVAAIPGVYKLVQDSQGPRIKLSQGKQTLPGKKQIYRLRDAAGTCERDMIALEHESVAGEPLLRPVVQNGRRLHPRLSLAEIRAYCLESLATLPAAVKALRVQEHYPVEHSPGLTDVIRQLSDQYAEH